MCNKNLTDPITTVRAGEKETKRERERGSERQRENLWYNAAHAEQFVFVHAMVKVNFKTRYEIIATYKATADCILFGLQL